MLYFLHSLLSLEWKSNLCQLQKLATRRPMIVQERSRKGVISHVQNPFFLFVCFSGETTCNEVETLTKLVFFLHSTFHITNGETALLVNWATSAFMRIIYSTLEWSIASIYTQILKLICVLKWYWLHLVLGFNSNIDWPFVMALTCGMVWSLKDVEKLLLNFLFCVHSYL